MLIIYSLYVLKYEELASLVAYLFIRFGQDLMEWNNHCRYSMWWQKAFSHAA